MSVSPVCLLFLLSPLYLTDPASELAEMERILTWLYPFPVLLNPRVGRDQLAARVGRIFSLENNEIQHHRGDGRKQAEPVYGKKTPQLYLEPRGRITTSVKVILTRSYTNSSFVFLQSQCSEEVEIVEEVKFVTSLQCQEELENKCHTSYVTR